MAEILIGFSRFGRLFLNDASGFLCLESDVFAVKTACNVAAKNISDFYYLETFIWFLGLASCFVTSHSRCLWQQ